MDGRLAVEDATRIAELGADGVPDVSDAYATGIGEWDKVAIAWGYSEFAPGTDERAALGKILGDAFGRGLRYLTDQDARPASSSSSVCIAAALHSGKAVSRSRTWASMVGASPARCFAAALASTSMASTKKKRLLCAISLRVLVRSRCATITPSSSV